MTAETWRRGATRKILFLYTVPLDCWTIIALLRRRSSVKIVDVETNWRWCCSIERPLIFFLYLDEDFLLVSPRGLATTQDNECTCLLSTRHRTSNSCWCIPLRMQPHEFHQIHVGAYRSNMHD